ncbi:MAG: protein translocase subunit SecDF [Bacteroidota bacterium]|nr:protein translocase subunit SecDF [Bacteroidota bacterium]
MKSKGAIRFFAIALAVVCLFQLSFTLVANLIERDADNYANGNEDRRANYLDSVKTEVVYNLGFGDVTLHKYTYADVKERELNLGLDLRGGIHVTLEVAQDKLLKELSNNNADPIFNQALADAKKEVITSQRNYIDVFTDRFENLKPGVQLAPYFATGANSAKIRRNSKNSDVVSYLKEEAGSALDRTFKILRTRIDQFGVTQPNIQVDNNSGRIIVELPGADDQERIKNLLKKSAKLEFFRTFTIYEVAQYLQDADKAVLANRLSSKVKANDPVAIAKAKKDSTEQVKLDSLDKLIASAGKDTIKAKTLSAAKGKILSTKTADDYPLLSLLNISEDLQRSNGPILGRVRKIDTSKVNAMLALPEVKSIFPEEFKFSWGAKTLTGTDVIELYALRGPDPALAGDKVIDARQDIDQQTNSFVVSMQMNQAGASEWASVTKQAASQNPKGHIAIVLDNQVYSAPRVNNEIPNGNSQITGDFSSEDAKDLANVLKAGKLPVELDIVDQEMVGPSLGKEAISKGLASLLIGLVVIVLFMIAYYNRSGYVANIAMLINLFFIIGVLTSLQAALTLPGMAGIVLTMAMAVDANVLIYERIREELGHAKGMRLAISDGFKYALSSIIDGNLTTLLIGIILMAFGSGPIYGFAIILVIGILTSLFCQILLSRLIFEWLLAKDIRINFGNKFTNNLFQNINFDFVGKRKIGYIFSVVTLVIAIASLATRGLNYAVEFEGGYSYTLQLDKEPDIEKIRSILTKKFNSNPEIKTFGDNNKLNITTDYLVDQNNDNTDVKVQQALMSGITEAGYKATILNNIKVTSTIASDIKSSSFRSILFGLLIVFGYIIIRFRRWQFAVGATVAIAHDAIVVLGVFSLLKDVLPFMDVDQSIVAGILTVIGYSVNDTVVVFDRIREYLTNNKKQPLIPTVNDAINHTLNRTVVTSGTVIIVVAILFIFGGPIIKGFSFSMLLGIVLGTYSSIFVATPIAVDLHSKKELQASTFAA